jgi:flagellar biosynthesis regulator FlbT
LRADDTVTPVHFTYFHFIMCCRFISQQNSAGSNEMFINPKKVAKGMAGFKERVPCTEIPNIFPLVSQVLLSL